jgi:hypothetical protein
MEGRWIGSASSLGHLISLLPLLFEIIHDSQTSVLNMRSKKRIQGTVINYVDFTSAGHRMIA